MMNDKEFRKLEQLLYDAKLNHTQYRVLCDVLRDQRERLDAEVKYTCRPGDRVTWKGKHGETCYGEVLKIMRKNAQIKKEDGMLRAPIWRVSLCLLQKA